jgi:hypothetical protein
LALGIPPVVLDEELNLAAVNPTLAVTLLNQELSGVPAR